ncbi:ethanolaminephosphotransferase 1-like [Ostrinia furnacalis]|uniref:ethanolaminephosphotransferase 1-like n=1 Tax=Ostrinia furnacalis TaxID=93504 RepID=UPI00103E4CF4|nr:ethanolaminephosphotransferase 1-like [Ostrinia furnacalis]
MERIFNYKYLNKNHFKGLEKHKYSAIDTSPLSNYVMHPFWNTSVKIFPKWLAPNLITFAGFVLMVTLVVLLGVFDYECRGPMGEHGVRVPAWVYTACGVCLFLAYNLDGIDGKQARRLGVSGPLGELFDHGIDSYVVFFIPYGLMAVFGRDHEFTLPTLRGLCLVISVCLNFYVSHWEKYSTGTLYLPWGYDLSMWASSMLYLAPGIYGPAVFRSYIFGQVTFVQALEVVVHVTGLVSTLPIAVYNVYLAHKTKSALHKSLIQTLRPVWSMLVMTAAIIAWAVKSPGNVLEYDPKAFVLLYGTYFSHISCRLIMAEMSRQRCDVITWMCWPLLTGVAVSLYWPHLEVPAMYSLLLFSLAGHLHYGVCVVRQLCVHYKINCFTVPKNKIK